MTRDEAPGLLDSVQALAATTMRGVHTRLQLAAVELEGERDRLVERLALVLAALLLGAFGLVLGVLWLVMWVDESHRLTALGVVALACFVAAAFSALGVRALARHGFMPATLGVLADDAHALAGGHAPRSVPARMPRGAIDA